MAVNHFYPITNVSCRNAVATIECLGFRPGHPKSGTEHSPVAFHQAARVDAYGSTGFGACPFHALNLAPQYLIDRIGQLTVIQSFAGCEDDLVFDPRFEKHDKRR